jgi:modulator of FtsH protease
MSELTTHQSLPFTDGTRERSQTLFARTMGLVALTSGVFALGAYLGRGLSGGVGIVAFIAAFAALLGMSFAVTRAPALTLPLLTAFGLLTGLATAPTLAYYSSADPAAVWQAGIATGLFMAGFGTIGFAARRDLTALARLATWALLGLIVFGLVLTFARIPHGALIYVVLGLLIFAALTVYDFQRLHRMNDIESAPLLTASIFLDALNVFLLFLDIFTSRDQV